MDGPGLYFLTLPRALRVKVCEFVGGTWLLSEWECK